MVSNNRLSLARDILLAIAISGGVLTIALVAPGILQIFGSLVKKYGRDNFYPSRVKTRFDSFRSRGLVTISERGGETTIRLTKAGKKMALSYQVDEMEIKPQKHWDGKWRIVFFDIPEKKASARNVFRDKLKELGFEKVQHSVWRHQYPCRNEVEFLVNLYEIDRYVELIEGRVIV